MARFVFVDFIASPRTIQALPLPFTYPTSGLGSDDGRTPHRTNLNNGVRPLFLVTTIDFIIRVHENPRVGQKESPFPSLADIAASSYRCHEDAAAYFLTSAYPLPKINLPVWHSAGRISRAPAVWACGARLSLYHGLEPRLSLVDDKWF